MTGRETEDSEADSSAKGRQRDKLTEGWSAPPLRPVVVIMGVAVASTSSLLVNLLIPRVLSASDAGIYFLAASIATFVPVALRLGTDQGIVRLLGDQATAGNDRQRVRSILRSLLLTTGIAAVFSALVLLVLWRTAIKAFFHSPVLAHLGLVCTLWIVFEGLRLPLSESLRGRGSIGSATMLGDCGRWLLFVVVIVGLAAIGHLSLRAIFAAAAVTSGLFFVATFATVARVTRLMPAGQQRERGSTRQLLRTSHPFLLTAMWNLIISQGDILIAATVLTPSALAPYALAVKTSLAMALPVTAVDLTLAPRIPSLWAAGAIHTLETDIRSATTKVGVFACLGIVIVSTLSFFALPALYGDAYIGAPRYLAILAIGPLAAALAGPNTFTLMMAGDGPLVAKITGVISLVQLALMIVVARTVGPYGLAAASTLGPIAVNIWASVASRRRLGVATEMYLNIRRLR